MSVDRSALSALEREKAAVFHSWSAQNAINPLMVKDAKGVYVTDMDDNTYLDFSSQLVNINIGHQHPAVVAAIKAQADLLCTVAPQHGNVARTPSKVRKRCSSPMAEPKRSSTPCVWRDCTPDATRYCRATGAITGPRPRRST